MSRKQNGRAAKYEVSDRVQLEIDLLDSAPAHEGARQRASGSEERMRAVLIVDDDADMCMYVEGCLKALGLPVSLVEQAGDGVEALEKLAGGKIDFIISDVVMPRMDGITLCERLLQDPDLRLIPVLLMSGEVALEEVRLQLGRQATVELLAKPFSARMLEHSLERLWSQRPPS